MSSWVIQTKEIENARCTFSRKAFVNLFLSEQLIWKPAILELARRLAPVIDYFYENLRFQKTRFRLIQGQWVIQSRCCRWFFSRMGCPHNRVKFMRRLWGHRCVFFGETKNTRTNILSWSASRDLPNNGTRMWSRLSFSVPSARSRSKYTYPEQTF